MCRSYLSRSSAILSHQGRGVVRVERPPGRPRRQRAAPSWGVVERLGSSGSGRCPSSARMASGRAASPPSPPRTRRAAPSCARVVQVHRDRHVSLLQPPDQKPHSAASSPAPAEKRSPSWPVAGGRRLGQKLARAPDARRGRRAERHHDLAVEVVALHEGAQRSGRLAPPDRVAEKDRLIAGPAVRRDLCELGPGVGALDARAGGRRRCS